jgi:hypothetical protein
MDMNSVQSLHKNFKLVLLAVIFVQSRVAAQIGPPDQQFIPITDSAPAFTHGLKAGYIITGESEKEVGKKGNFSRYKIRFYITNTTGETRVLRDREMPHPNQSGALLVRFACLNATGARLTSTECSISASPFNGEEWAESKDSHGNNIRVKRVVNLGYGIRPGESISANTIMIVPLDQRPQITAIFSPSISHYVTYLPGPMAPAGQPGYNTAPPPSGAPASQYGSTVSQSGPSVVWLKNTVTGTFLNTPKGQLVCNGVDHSAWGCEWELLPVTGANYFLIRNRFQNKFLSTENANLLSDNSQAQAALWSIEQSVNAATFTIRNAVNNAPLILQNGIVVAPGDNNGQNNTACWFIEHQ